MRNILILALVIAFAFTAFAQEPQTSDSALEQGRSLIRRVAKGLEGIERLHGEFTQEQHTLLLDEPLKSKGKLHLRSKPGCLVMEMTEPKSAWLRSDATSHQVYHPESKRAERYLFKSNDLAKSLLSILTVDITEIEKAFRLKSYQQKPGEDTLKLELLDESKRRMMDELELFVNTKTDQLSGVAFVNGDGERVVIRFSKLRTVSAKSAAKERARDEKVFETALPKDVKLVVHTFPTKEAGE